MNEQSSIAGTRMGTAGGTLTILLANINSGDLFKTITLAAIGATVSFVMSFVLKKMVKWLRKPQP